MSLRVAVLGATGLVGETLLRILEDRSFPATEVIPLASERSAGSVVTFHGTDLAVRAAHPDSFEGVDLVLSSAGRSVSTVLLPHAVAHGAIAVDNTSAFRMDGDVPLVVPEVNEARVLDARRGIVANPNCSTIQLVMALKPILDRFGIRRARVSTYQSFSGAGRAALQRLREESHHVLRDGVSPPSNGVAFNAIPAIGAFLPDGSTEEEQKMVDETSRILDTSIPLHAMCVRVPTLVGHGVSVCVETERPASPSSVRGALRDFAGVSVVDDPERALAPSLLDAVDGDETLVGRVRADPTVENGISFWIAADNIRKGAALNTVQIAEALVRRGVLRRAPLTAAV